MSPFHEFLIDDVTESLAAQLAPLIRPESLEAFELSSLQVAHAMRIWVQSGFCLGRIARPTLPNKLVGTFTDPQAAVYISVELLTRYGLVREEIQHVRDCVLERLEIRQMSYMAPGQIVGSNLLDAVIRGGFSGEGNALFARKLQWRLRTEMLAKIESDVQREFGSRARLVLEALRANDAANERHLLLRETNEDVSNGRFRTVSASYDEYGEIQSTAGQLVIEGYDFEDISQISSTYGGKRTGGSDYESLKWTPLSRQFFSQFKLVWF